MRVKAKTFGEDQSAFRLFRQQIPVDRKARTATRLVSQGRPSPLVVEVRIRNLLLEVSEWAPLACSIHVVVGVCRHRVVVRRIGRILIVSS
jgi:hypothetical protein